MSEFSECLSYFIKEGKTDTALLEERTGVPCSVIASFLKGKELPEQSVFRILLRELPLTVEEERILSHCYYVSSVGEWTYRRRSYMQQQLSALVQMIPRDTARPDCNSIEPADFHTLPKEGIQLYRGPFAVEGVLHQILSEELSTQERPMYAQMQFCGRGCYSASCLECTSAQAGGWSCAMSSRLQRIRKRS